MNYLAHAYLSFRNPGILAGNMISDFVKGKKQYDYPGTVQQGIRLHRAIDTFTDAHPATRAAKEYFRPAVGAYAGAFIDVVYDHFLALDTNELTETGWKAFAAEVYQQLDDQQSILPEKFARMLPYMRSQDWLYNYRFTIGIENSFNGLARRASYLSGAENAFAAFTEHYDILGAYYHAFFPDVKKFALAELAARSIG
jgi:acyl carrier protein phosphodiesterase